MADFGVGHILLNICNWSPKNQICEYQWIDVNLYVEFMVKI